MSAQPLEVRMAHLEGAYIQLDKRLGDMVSMIDSRFAQVDSRFAQVDGRLEALDRRLDAVQWRIVALIIGTWITTIATVLLRR